MQVTKVAPVGDRVLVKVVEPEQTTTGGILLPNVAQKRPTQGEVVGVGAGKGVTSGDTVVYSKYAGTEVEVQGAAHVILKEDDVIGVLPGADVSALRPLQDRVLIEVMEAEDTTSGGLLLTDSAKDKPTIGKVIAVGPGRSEDDKMVTPTVAAGATVLYQKYSGTEFEAPSGKSYIVVRDLDILAVLA
jgi:chaperonin GroES